MIDLFEINHFLLFLKKEYPEIEVKTMYNPISEMVRVKISKKYDSLFYDIPAISTGYVIERINAAFIDYLASISRMITNER